MLQDGSDAKGDGECFPAEGSLDSYIARLLETKIRLINAVEADDVPSAVSSSARVKTSHGLPSDGMEVKRSICARTRAFRIARPP